LAPLREKSLSVLFNSRPAGGSYSRGMKMDKHHKHHAKGEQGKRQLVEQKSALTPAKTAFLYFRFLKYP
jgi:hypothetical protein